MRLAKAVFILYLAFLLAYVVYLLYKPALDWIEILYAGGGFGMWLFFALTVFAIFLLSALLCFEVKS